MDLLILGASARAAAFSASRAGLRPTCVDLFGDADLVACGPSLRIDASAYPDGLANAAGSKPSMPWLYTGAIENRPDLVDRIASERPLLGNAGPVLRKVRDPFALAEFVRAAGLHAPEIRSDSRKIPGDGLWLAKPLASGGGRGIRPWTGDRPHRKGTYYQRRVTGLPASALFVGEAAGARLLGLTRQLLGKPGNRFAYRGSLAPWPASPIVMGRLDRLGKVLTEEFALRGLFGVDLVLEGDRPWVIEVNPRYTASVEVLEWALGRSLMVEHLQAFGIESVDRTSEGVGFAAKAIIYARAPLVWSAEWAGPQVDPMSFPEVADIPRPGTRFAPGDPILTVFSNGNTPERCLQNLEKNLDRWKRTFPGIEHLPPGSRSDLRIDQEEEEARDEEDPDDGRSEAERASADHRP